MEKLNELYLRISPGKFHFLKFILEGYDNLAILSSSHARDGIVVLRYPETMTRDLFELLSCLGGVLSADN